MKSKLIPQKLLLFVSLLVFTNAKAQISIKKDSVAVQNFNSIGNTATASLPANWKMSAAGNGTAATWTSGTNIAVTTQAAETGSPTNGGAYNWGSDAGNDRAVGFMTSASYSTSNSIMAFYRNTTGTIVTSITVTFQIERYRTNTGLFDLNFFSSTDGTAWTARTGGDIINSAFPAAASSYNFVTPKAFYKSVTITGLSIANNGDFYLKWVFNTNNTNSQGLGLDNVGVYAGAATPVISATLRDQLTNDLNSNGQPNAGDQLTYTTTIRNSGSGNANTVNLTEPAPITTTLNGAVRTSALARDDSYSTPMNTVLNATAVLANDFGLPSLSVASFGATNNATLVTANGTNSSSTDNGGTVVMNTNGTFTYTPAAGFTGIDKFSYVAATATLPNNDAVVTITVGTAPASVNDVYSAIGNISITHTNATGVLLNDGAANGISVVAVNGNAANVGAATTTTQGGNITVNTDGSFTYNPPAGYEGADQFTYTIDNGFAAPSTATVTLNVSGMIWFINNTAGAGGDGRLSSPFNTVAAFQTVNTGVGNNPAANDYIFVYESAADYAGSFTLLNGQKLIGQDASATLGAITGYSLPAGSAALPVTNSANGIIVNLTTTVASTTVITLNTVSGSNLLRGFTIGNKTLAGIVGTSFGSLTASDITITGTGQALGLTNGAVTATFASVSSSSSVNAVVLNNTTGTLTINAGNISGATGTTFSIVGGTISVTYSGSMSQANNAALVSISGGHATGTITFQTGTLSATNGTGLQFDNADGIYNFNGTNTMNGGDAGIDIIVGSTGTFTFSSNSSITNPSGTAFLISASNCNGTYSGSISDNTGFLIDIVSHSAGTFTFQTGTLTSSGQGIRVINCVAGTMNFTNATKTLTTTTNTAVTLNNNGTSIINFTGGGLAITTTSGNGFDVSGGAGGVTVTGTGNIISSTTGIGCTIVNTTIGAGGITFQSISANGAANGILLSNTGSTGTFTVTGVGTTAGSGGTIQNSTDDAIRLTSVNTVTLNLININNSGNAAGEYGIDMNTSVSVVLNRISISGSTDHGISATGGSNLQLLNSTILNAGNAANEHAMNLTNFGGTLTIDNSVLDAAADDLLRITNNSVNLTVTIQNNSIFRNTGNTIVNGNNAIIISPNGTSGIATTITNCTFTNIKGVSAQQGAAALGSNGTSSLSFTNNTVSASVANKGGAVNYSGNNSIIATFTVTGNSWNNCTGPGLVVSNAIGNSTLTATISNNTIQNAANSYGVGVFAEDAATNSTTVSNNTITNVGSDGIQVANFGNNDGAATIATLNCRMTGNIINTHNTSTTGFAFIAGISVFGFEDNIFIDLRNNSVTGTPSPAGAFFDYYLQRDAGSFRVQGAGTAQVTSANILAPGVLNNTGDSTPPGQSTPSAAVVGTIIFSNGVICPAP
jgi:hypothetical protein